MEMEFFTFVILKHLDVALLWKKIQYIFIYPSYLILALFCKQLRRHNNQSMLKLAQNTHSLNEFH